jgi:hypothetical protein
VKFRWIENILDVLKKYEILGFFKMDLNRLNYYQIKTWDLMTETQISAGYRYIENTQKLGKIHIFQYADNS